MSLVDINDYDEQKVCTYKGELYSVRDNGAVCRHKREGKRKRPKDEIWTFGKPNNNGYMVIVSEVVHRIVAYAFLGEPPTQQYIVDHIDTNRQNNRPENLRWLTKLENILNNPITIRRIIHRCGSLEAFLQDPSILQNHIGKDPNYAWMRTVTPEEAQRSWERLKNWANKDNTKPSSEGGSLGEWLFEGDNDALDEEPEDIESLTPNAIQRDWRIPSEFPCCLAANDNEKPIASYYKNLEVGNVFAKNQIYGKSIIHNYSMSEDQMTLWILCKSSEDNAIKPWTLAQVNFEDNVFIHKNLGSFFKQDGAEKYFTLAQGLKWEGGETFDDFA